MTTLATPVTIQSIITHYQVNRITDDPITKIVFVEVDTNLSHETLVLWSDEEYVAIGQYTDTDIKNRVEQIINAKK